jgi:hypothetical protein
MFPFRFNVEDGVEIWWRGHCVTLLPLLFLAMMMVGVGSVVWATLEEAAWLAFLAFPLILLPSILVAALIWFGNRAR